MYWNSLVLTRIETDWVADSFKSIQRSLSLWLIYAFSGEPRVGIYEDDWTAVTMDNSRAAQAEHTILITESGCEILTL